MLERRACSPWLATLVTGAVCLSVWQMIGCPGPPGGALLASPPPQPPAYALLTAANATAEPPPYALDHLRPGDYARLVDLQGFRFLQLGAVCNGSAPLLLVLVHSAPANEEKRATIRSTWGAPRPGLRVAFLVGEAQPPEERMLRAEQRRYGDLVQGSFHDAYRNMTYKHVMALKFAAYHCPRARYVLKTDDDVFVNMPTVMAFLSVELSPFGARRLLLCRPLYDSFVKRSYRSKWRVSYREYPDKRYPPYCPGWAILYSPDVAFMLYKEAQRADYFWIDDVLVTGVLAERAHVEHTPVSSALVLSPDAVAELVRANGSRPHPTFLYGPPDMRPADIHALWGAVSHQYERHSTTAGADTDE